MTTTPDYKLIYTDIITKKFPHKKEKCQVLLNKSSLSVLNIIEINSIIFEKPDLHINTVNQKHRSYKKADILQILSYQKKNNLNNRQVALHFKMSRNTVAKWKKLFL